MPILNLITIAFARPDLISQQLRLLRKYVPAPYTFHVVDNNNDSTCADATRTICEDSQYDVQYYRCPEIDNQREHGRAMNWAWQNIVRTSGDMFNYWGYLDHDIFPMRAPVGLFEKIDKLGLYGLQQSRPGKWYLWPGYCFFDKRRLSTMDLNFKSYADGDTGSSNYPIIYDKINRDDVPPCAYKVISIHGDGHIHIDQLDSYQIIDNEWLHMQNGSMWYSGDEHRWRTKEAKVLEILNGL